MCDAGAAGHARPLHGGDAAQHEQCADFGAGNSDLLLLEPGSLSAQTRAQIETIRNMTLRIHEIMQRFSSLEKEMNVVAQQAVQDSCKSYAATPGC